MIRAVTSAFAKRIVAKQPSSAKTQAAAIYTVATPAHSARPISQSHCPKPTSAIITHPTTVSQPKNTKQSNTIHLVDASLATIPSTTTSSTTTRNPISAKQWPLKLPECLRPKEGTTYYEMFVAAASTSPSTTATGSVKKPVALMQALLYGVPDPEQFQFRTRITRASRILEAVLWGVKDEQGDVEKVVQATQTVEGFGGSC